MSNRNPRNVRHQSGLSFSYARTSLAIDFETGQFVVQLPRVNHIHVKGLAPLHLDVDHLSAIPVLHRHRLIKG